MPVRRFLCRSCGDDPNFVCLVVQAIVTSISTNYEHWTVTGAASLYNVSKAGFKLYLSDGMQQLHPQFAQFYHWEVSYIGYYGDHYVLSIVVLSRSCLVVRKVSGR